MRFDQFPPSSGSLRSYIFRNIDLWPVVCAASGLALRFTGSSRQDVRWAHRLRGSRHGNMRFSQIHRLERRQAKISIWILSKSSQQSRGRITEHCSRKLRQRFGTKDRRIIPKREEFALEPFFANHLGSFPQFVRANPREEKRFPARISNYAIICFRAFYYADRWETEQARPR